MTIFPTEVLVHIRSFLDPSTALVLSCLSKAVIPDVSTFRDLYHRNLYQKGFGQIKKVQQLDKTVLKRLLCCIEKKPSAAVKHKIYQAPTTFLERWKWIVGVENSLDREVQELYNNQIGLLENSEATSIIQLKNQLIGFWHTDCQLKDYQQFASDEKARATSSRMRKIFFICLAFLFKLYFKPSIVTLGKNLEARSRKTCAKIGGFIFGVQKYEVVSFHLLSDEGGQNGCQLEAVCSGKTCTAIVKRQESYSFDASMGGLNPNFSVQIARKRQDRDTLAVESFVGSGEWPVLNSERHLIVSDLQYCGSSNDPQGSDRLLDQKLTQIMVEMTLQNKKIISLKVGSNNDDLPVLTAGGFKNGVAAHVMEELNNFRAEDDNKLFPPYKDYSSVSTQFETKDFSEKNVFYSRGAPESWSDIVQRKPILNRDAAVLPEYWVKEPKIVEEKPNF